jgi:type I restriction enzyme, S subunit
MLAFLVAVPPVDEQRIISKVIEDSVGRCDALIAEANRAVDLLVERRAALIAAAVTGKVDARGLVPKPEAVAA